jgi:hypothetical protein
MIRLGSGIIVALIASHVANAGEMLPAGQGKARANARCAALGEGFFPVAGSDACIKISGRISAGVGFGSGGGGGLSNSSSLDFNASRNNGSGAEAAATGDLRFDTSAGPGRVYLGVGKNSHWVIDSQ